jgi:RNA polymerase sigma factor (sigma-70 family)
MRKETSSSHNTSATHGTSAELLTRYLKGDDRAAEEIFERYIDRLTRLARSRLSPKLAQRVDAEDVVMSAWRSFFVAAGAGRFSLKRSGDLWRLLVSITLHKLYRQARRHTAERRTVDGERSIDDAEMVAYAADRQPTPDEAVALAEEMQHILANLDDFGRRVLELRLQGETHAGIAADTNRSERSVRRKLHEIQIGLTNRFGAESDDEGF